MQNAMKSRRRRKKPKIMIESVFENLYFRRRLCFIEQLYCHFHRKVTFVIVILIINSNKRSHIKRIPLRTLGTILNQKYEKG